MAPTWDIANAYEKERSCEVTVTCSSTTSASAGGHFAGSVTFMGAASQTNSVQLIGSYVEIVSLPKVRQATFTVQLNHNCADSQGSAHAQVGGRMKVREYSKAVKDPEWETPSPTVIACPSTTSETISLTITPKNGSFLSAGKYLIEVTRYLTGSVDSGFAGEVTFSEAGGTSLTRS